MNAHVFAMSHGGMTEKRKRVHVQRSLWPERANCLGRNIKLFFPDDEESFSAGVLICHECSVREQCLKEALRIESQTSWSFGVFGGMNPQERRLLIDRQRMENRVRMQRNQ